MTLKMIRKQLNLIHTTVYQMLTNELGMRKIAQKMTENDFLEYIDTGDEFWVFEYDLKIKYQSILTSPRPKKQDEDYIHAKLIFGQPGNRL